jgi:predicted amidohydrolase YtcJ
VVGLERVPAIASLLLVAALLACAPKAGAPYPTGEPEPGKKTVEPAELILHGGLIWTVDDDQPRAEAVAVRHGKFVAVGHNEEVLALRGYSTEVIDLDGKLVVPGFIDSHVHFDAAAAFHDFNIMKVSSQEEFVHRVEEVVARLPDGEWILGGFWGAYDAWAESSAGGQKREAFTPDMARIRDITAKHPVFLRKFDGSEFAANGPALSAAGVDPKRPRAKDVTFLRGKSREITGIMQGKGVLPLFERVVPKSFSHERRVMQTKRALEEVRKHGVTNIGDISDDEQLAIFRELRERGELTTRVNFRYHMERYEELAKEGIAVGSGDAWIRLGMLKGHIDGIMGTSGARFLEPYDHAPDNRGYWRRLLVDAEGEFVEGKFLKYMIGADAAGQQLSIHAIGDEANRLLLDYLDELERKNGKKDRRVRVVHAQVVHPDDMQRLGKLGVVAEIQPFHLSDDMRWMEERIGKERCRGAYAFRSIKESGAVLSFGTDWPGTSAAEYPIDPMPGLYAAITRQTLSGEPAGGWFPAERIDIETAIRAYTLGSAYANFEEDIAGSIEVGKLADMAVLSRNLLEIEPREILGTHVVYTIVDGRIVYERD